MKTYKIEVNAIESEYKAETKEQALEKYANDAGYKSYEDLQQQHPEEVKATRI